MQQRYYDPIIGRFYSNDPLGFTPSNPMMFNRYGYANNNPYKYVDPDGREVESFIIKNKMYETYNQALTNVWSDWMEQRNSEIAAAHQEVVQQLDKAAYVAGELSGPISAGLGFIPHPATQGGAIMFGIISDLHNQSVAASSGNMVSEMTSHRIRDIVSNSGQRALSGRVKGVIHVGSALVGLGASEMQEASEKQELDDKEELKEQK